MKRWLVSTLVAAVILTLGVVAALNSSGSSEESFDGPGNSAAAHSRNDDRKSDKNKEDKGEKDEKDEKAENDGQGPPSWAHRKDSKSDRAAAREEWRKLTPEQRRELMDRLVREHTEAMQKWGECVAANRDDCEMPPPPGRAKKQGR